MCKAPKFVGAVALCISLAYNVITIIALLTYIAECINGGCINDSGDILDAECYEALFELYYIYIPTVTATVIILLTGYRNPYYLHWWIASHLSLMIVCPLSFMCMQRVFDRLEVALHSIATSLMTCCLVLMAYHLIKIIRSNADEAESNTDETNA